MPQKCCVPGCKSNYSSQEYISVFTFPSDPVLKEKWVQLIGRRDYVVNKNSVVCAKHFQPHFVVTVDSVKRDDGTFLCVPRTKPKLQSDAFPTIFPHVPSSPSSSESPKKMKAVSEKLGKHWGSIRQTGAIKDSIASFQSLCKEINNHIQQWNSRSDLCISSPQCGQPSKAADQGETAYITLKLEFLEQQRKYMHIFTDHYIDRMIREGNSWTKKSAKRRPDFTDICQNLDKAVEFLCLMCEELSSTVTADMKDGKLTHPKHYESSQEVADSVAESESRSTTTASSDKRQQVLTSGQLAGMYSCPNCLTVFTSHDNLCKHISEAHGDSSSEMGHDEELEGSDESPMKADSKGGCHSDDSLGKNKLGDVTKGGQETVVKSLDIQSVRKKCSRKSKRGGKIVQNTNLADGTSGESHVTSDEDVHGNQKLNRQTHGARELYESGILNTSLKTVGSQQMLKRKHKRDSQKTVIDSREKALADSSQSVEEDSEQQTVAGSNQHTPADSSQLITENSHIVSDSKQPCTDMETSNITSQETLFTKESKSETDVNSIRQRARNRRKLRMLTIEKPYSCDICSIGFRSLNRMQTHKRRHQGGQSFQCDLCDAGFDRSYQLKAHMSKHTGVKPFHCDVCGAGFTVKSTMQIHMRKHTGEKPYICADCGARFVNRRKLKIHGITHTGEKPYKCDVCDAGFNQAFSLQLHKRKHTGEKPYRCEVCGLEFAGNCSLKIHRRRHTGEKPYRCDVCGVGFTHNVGLQIHKSRHKGDKPYVCEMCGLKFSVHCSLQYHKRKHAGDKPYRCDICGVRFSVKSSLINHKRKHTGETPYDCDICGLRFSVVTSLQNHRRKHTGEKPYLCDICGTEFAHSGSLRDHKRVHTGEKPYKCGMCGEEFSNRKKLQRHRKVHAEEHFYTSGILGLEISESNPDIVV